MAAYNDTDPVFRILSKLKNVQQIGPGKWSAQCPAHDDRKNSLSVSEGRDGKALLFCHANCEKPDVLRACQAIYSDLFRSPPSRRRGSNATANGAPKTGKIVATYPYHAADGSLRYEVVRFDPKDFRQRRPDGNGGWIWKMQGVTRILYRLPELLAADPTTPVYVCYSDDTDILTSSGWIRLSNVTPQTLVAQYSADTGEISFVNPLACQQFFYDGEMVNFRSRWCNLLVTPDHRQLVKYPNCKPKTVFAEDVSASHQLPTAGVLAGSGGPIPTEARLLVAWLADGTNEKRGHKTSWNLKKQRKKERIRFLLSMLSIPWTERESQSAPGWTRFCVYRHDMASVFKWCNGKRWLPASMFWDVESRKAILDELAFWDGDSSGKNGVRFFTSDRHAADVVSAIAAVTNRHVNLRVDRRPNREKSSDAFVLNINDRAWRTISKKPRRVSYRGPVYCCTVETGYLVVRRNGKVTISGNCEGEKDVDRLRASGLIATTIPGGAGKWLPQYAETLRGRIVYLIPDADPPNPRTGKRVGWEHVALVANALHGIAASVRAVTLPVIPGIDPTKKWDVSDWLDAGGTREQFQAAVDSFPEWTPTAATPKPMEISNGQWVNDNVVPLPIGEILSRIHSRTGDWPRRVGPSLFAHDPGYPVNWLHTAAATFGWLGAKANSPAVVHRGVGYHGRDEIFCELQRTSQEYKAIETYPHEPPISGHYYACEPVEPGDGQALRGLIERFCPETPIDADLFLALFATLLWGGPGGTRPCFVITSSDGRGAGKSKNAAMAGYLVGGVVELSANEDAAEMKKRLLSPSGRERRVALLDNVKTLRFSWAELESAITSTVISGREMYVGESQRPNTITWILTLNGVSLATDMAQRAVVIKIRRPEYSAGWEEATRQYIDDHRPAILADLIGFLRSDREPLARYTRWGTWERDILSRLPEPGDAQKAILERQGEADVEGEESDLIEEYFGQKLREVYYNTDTDRVFISSQVSSQWLIEATREKHSVSGCSRVLKQKIGEGKLPRLQVNVGKVLGRGFIWTGKDWDLSTGTNADLETRISEQRKRKNSDGMSFSY